MFPESKVTEIYCMADDFCKDNSCPHRNNPNRMSDADHGNLYFVFFWWLSSF